GPSGGGAAGGTSTGAGGGGAGATFFGLGFGVCNGTTFFGPGAGAATGATTAGPAATTDAPACAGELGATAAGGVVFLRSLVGAVAPGAVCARGGVVHRRMMAGTWRRCVGGTLFGAPEGMPLPTSKARSQIWNEETIPATTRAVQMTHESQLRIGGIIAVR